MQSSIPISALAPGDYIYLERKSRVAFGSRTRTVVVTTTPEHRVEGSQSWFFDALERRGADWVRNTVCAGPAAFERVEVQPA